MEMKIGKLADYLSCLYGPMGINANWGALDSQRNQSVTRSSYTVTAETFFESGMLPAVPRGGTGILLSPSANTGLYEEAFAKTLPFKVLAGDIVGVRRQRDHSIPLQLNAFYLPIRDNTVDVIFDRLGALWHAVDYDITHHNDHDKLTHFILGEYYRVLKPGGALILDGDSQFDSIVYSTIYKLQRFLSTVPENLLRSLSAYFDKMKRVAVADHYYSQYYFFYKPKNRK